MIKIKDLEFLSPAERNEVENYLKLGGNYEIVTILNLGSWPEGFASHVHWWKKINSEEEFISFMKSHNARLNTTHRFPRFTCDYHSRNHKNRHYTLWIETEMVVMLQTVPQIHPSRSYTAPHPDWVMKYISNPDPNQGWAYITKFNN